MRSVQTGLRVPEEQYVVIRRLADKTGVSINAMILMLVELGLKAFQEHPPQG